jgi:hypothetical protein
MESMLLSVWFMSMVALLLSSNVIPNAFNIAITIFYVPLVVFVFYVLFLIVPKDVWLLFGLMLRCICQIGCIYFWVSLFFCDCFV